MWRSLSHRIKANMIFKVSRLSVAELVKTFAQLLGTEGPPSSSVQGRVPRFFFTHENQNTEKDGGKKVPCSIQKENFKLIIYIFGGKGRNKLYKWNSINLVILWVFLDDFKIHRIQLWILGNWKQSQCSGLEHFTVNATVLGRGCLPHRRGIRAVSCEA